MNEEALKHTPVLLNEVINAINPQSGKLYFDATFGWGGYSEKLLDTCASVSYTHLRAHET